jgi:dTDP-4-dehydrorhamnose reductase
MRILAFGGWGQLGSDLAIAAEGRHTLLRPAHAEVDVTNAEAVERSVLEHHPDAVIDAAAFHRVEACEREPGMAFAVNAVGALSVARAAFRAGATCVFVSSDYVFDGAKEGGYVEDDPLGPVNVYGASKASGEWLVSAACLDSLIVRASGLFGHAGSSAKGGNFIETILAKAASGEALSVVDDRFFSPTSTADLAERILLLLESRSPAGVYHLANAGSCSWYELAEKTFELAGMAPSLSRRETDQKEVRRPRSSILLDTRTARAGLPPARPWQEALHRYLRERNRPDDRIRSSPE